jgi:hypothetical protein
MIILPKLLKYFPSFRHFSSHRKQLKFLTGASAKPKTHDLPIKPFSIPPHTSLQVGEDSFYIRHDSIGVADGVGGWSEIKGANPALYSLKLMHCVQIQLEQYDAIVDDDYGFDLEPYSETTPKYILTQAYERTSLDAKREKILGSATAMILILRV